MSDLDVAVARLQALGVQRIESFAWRDLDDPEAGGSELHADEILTRWAAAGIEVAHRTSTHDAPREFERNGYSVMQRGGRFDVFARVFVRQLFRRRNSGTATLEIWNGVPWFGPLWAPRRRMVWLHHVHTDMWDEALPRPFSLFGRLLESSIAPPFYRRSRFATLSESSAVAIRELGIADERLTVIPPGVHERFTPDPTKRSTTPHVVVVGRLAPVKRQRLALDALLEARQRHEQLTVDIVGDGLERAAVESWIDRHAASSWVSLRGRVSDDDLVAAYRSAWLVVSASHAEGWGMTLTEGGACGTPCVATDIAGHRGAVIDGATGMLVGDSELGAAVTGLLADDARRSELGAAAVQHAQGLSWSAVAAQQLDVLSNSLR